MTASTPRIPLLIDGEFVQSATGHWQEVVNPATQQVLAQRKKRLVRVDCHFPGTNVVVELLGYQFHRTPMQMQEDAERVNRLQLDGYVVMQFTYTDVVTRSTVMRETLAEALRRSDVQ